MIGSLRGRLARKSIDEVTIEVAGIGWRVSIPLSTYEALPSEGDEAALVTHLHVREDELTLYGFASARERSLFETLIGVSGVGPRLALHVLSRLTPERFVAAIRARTSAPECASTTAASMCGASVSRMASVASCSAVGK